LAPPDLRVVAGLRYFACCRETPPTTFQPPAGCARVPVLAICDAGLLAGRLATPAPNVKGRRSLLVKLMQ
jgi:hypothetical protein